jgi:hypothetical protein
MKMIRLNKGRALLGALLTFTIGGALLIWGYRRWNRRIPAQSPMGRNPKNDVQAEAEKLSGKFHSLDQMAQSGRIPKGLEKEPKNLDQAIHPG